jgi:hypothetical protein
MDAMPAMDAMPDLGGEVRVKTVFALTLLIIVGGLVYFATIGLLHR